MQTKWLIIYTNCDIIQIKNLQKNGVIFMREKRCCFTGHRPGKMEYSEADIRPLLEKAIDEAIEEEISTFITGMAPGTDMWAAEIVLSKMETNPDVHLVCALPHPGFEKRRTDEEKAKFNDILKKADYVKLVNERYFTGCYQVRNEWMVNHVRKVIAVFNGKPSGTGNTVRYAKKMGVEVVNLI